MAFEQAAIRVENEREFGELQAALDKIFAASCVTTYLKQLGRNKIRVRDWETVLATNALDVVQGVKRGSARALYEGLTVSDQAQMRELYLSKLEEVDPALRTRFSRLYQYY